MIINLNETQLLKIINKYKPIYEAQCAGDPNLIQFWKWMNGLYGFTITSFHHTDPEGIYRYTYDLEFESDVKSLEFSLKEL